MLHTYCSTSVLLWKCLQANLKFSPKMIMLGHLSIHHLLLISNTLCLPRRTLVVWMRQMTPSPTVLGDSEGRRVPADHSHLWTRCSLDMNASLLWKHWKRWLKQTFPQWNHTSDSFSIKYWWAWDTSQVKECWVLAMDTTGPPCQYLGTI